jgi:predicted ATPase/transcriptional regulator with XRE-family HTH domain
MTESETYSFGEWLKQRREQLRFTQRELASMTYCSVPMIKKIESDERHPSPELAELLADALRVPESAKPNFVDAARGERPVDALWGLEETADIAAPVIAFREPFPLPKPVTAFIGRADELQAIGERLTNTTCRLLTLVGPGGAGKSRLALAAAQSQLSTFADGAAFVPLESITDAAAVSEAIARSLRLTLIGPANEQVLAFLQRRNLLLILDNCEQLEGDLGFLSELLNYARGVKILATSRERLRLSEEWVYIVPELAEAAVLFIDTAERVKHDFDAEAEQADIQRICQLVGNLPLAVELAASWTSLMSCSQIADHIERDLNILASDMRNVPDRHRSIQAVFEYSWKLLSAVEQNALMRLSVFRGGWQAEQSTPVADADLLLLRRLVDKSLVRVRESGRYDLHELIRQYAGQKLVQSGLESETHQRHFDAYFALAAQLDAEQFSAQGLQAVALQAVARFDREHDNLRTALAWSLEAAEPEVPLRLLYHLVSYWIRRGYYHEGGEWTLRAIQRADDLDVVDSIYLTAALSDTGVFLFLQGRFAEGEALARRSVEMAYRLEEPEALIAAYSTYTFTSVNIEQALDALHKGMALIEETGKMQPYLPLFYLGAATWLHSGGRHAEAADYYRRSIALHREMGAVDMIADAVGRLGQLALEEGRLQEAYDLTMQSIEDAAAGGYEVTFGAWGGTRLGLIQLYMGNADAAQQSLESDLGAFDDHHDARVKLEALSILSEVLLARGEVQAAVTAMQDSLRLCRRLYDQLQSTQKLEGTPDALPIDLISLCPRASLIAAAQGQDTRAITLYSIATLFRVQTGQVMIPPLQAKLDDAMSVIRDRVLDDSYNAAWDAGQQMSLAEAFEFLLG